MFLPVGDRKMFLGTDVVRTKGWYEEGGIFHFGEYGFQKKGTKIKFFKKEGMTITREFLNGGSSGGGTSFLREVAVFNKMN